MRSIGCSRVGALLDETLFWAGELRSRSGTMASPATLAWCRSSLIEQGQLEVAGAAPLAIAPPLVVPPANRKTGHPQNHELIYSGRGGCGFLAGVTIRGWDSVRVGSGNRAGSGSLFSR